MNIAIYVRRIASVALLVCAVALSTLCLYGCAGKATNTASSELQGVTVTSEGSVAVTFELPEGKSIDEVLGSAVKENNSASIQNVSAGTATVVHWSRVEGGGIVSWWGDVYRFAPTAEVTNATGVNAPPTYAMIYGLSDTAELLNPNDADELARRYGIALNL